MGFFIFLCKLCIEGAEGLGAAIWHEEFWSEATSARPSNAAPCEQVKLDQAQRKQKGNLQDGRGKDVEITFLPINTSKIHLHVEQLLQNTHQMLAEDLRLPKRQENTHVPGCVADRVLVLWPGIRPEPLRWESRVKDIGPPEASWPQVTSIGEGSPRDLHLNAKTQLCPMASKLQCWTPHAK